MTRCKPKPVLLLGRHYTRILYKTVTSLQTESSSPNSTTDSQATDGTPSQLCIAWLYPSLARGSYWHPLFSRFSRQYPNTTIYTGEWPGFATGYEGDFAVEVVGETKVLNENTAENGYSRTYFVPSFGIIPKLLTSRPDIIFASGFSLWTVIALVIKLFFRTRVIILLDGVSPGVDYLNYGTVRVLSRRIMRRYIDAYITNSKAGRKYLLEVVGAKRDDVFVQSYLVPDISALNDAQTDSQDNTYLAALEANLATVSKPIFLSVGQIVHRKGLAFLIEACKILKQKEHQFTLLVVGDGKERSALETLASAYGLADYIQWMGAVDYHRLGIYFDQADVFVFPTLEDIWGMVVPEAMTFGNPVLCSKWAGVTEIFADGDCGYIFDPRDVDHLAELMSRFIEQPSLIDKMGARSRQIAAELTPQKTAAFFCQLAATI